MDGRCERHLFDQAIDLCDRCGAEFCGDCLVYSFGPKKPPYCLPCAVEAAGVRKGAGYRPATSRRERKQIAKDRDALLRRRAAAAERGDLAESKSWMDGDVYAMGD
jgi:hypothetical protein